MIPTHHPVASSREAIEQRIQELHRQKLEKDLENIGELFRQYTNQAETTTQKRRRENIYVLFALGIVGAFFSVISGNEIFRSQSILFGFGVFAVAALIFLLIKMNTVALSDRSSSQHPVNKWDSYT